MKEYLSKWYMLMDTFPTSVKVMFYILTGIILGFFFLMRFRKFRDVVFEFTENRLKFSMMKISKAASHDLFYRQSYYDSIIRKINLHSDVKTFSFKAILGAKTETFISEMKKFSKDSSWKKFNNAKLFNLYVHHLNVSLDNYSNRVKAKYIEKYGDVRGKNLFNYIYTNYFEPPQNERIEKIIEQIKGLTESNFLSQSDKTVIFLTFVMYFLDTSVIDAEKTFQKFNGEPARIINQ